MNKVEALRVLGNEMVPFRAYSYSELVRLIGAAPFTKEVTVKGGTTYQVEIIVHWDGEEGGAVRVHGCVDDGGWRGFLPLSDDFLKSATGEFIDE